MDRFSILLLLMVSSSNFVMLQTILTVTPSQNVLVDKLVTFTCTFNTNPTGVMFALSGTGSVCALEELNGACKSSNGCTSAESRKCPNSTTYIAQMKAKLEWDEQSFTCTSLFGGSKSNSVTITLSVPVTSVIISQTNVIIKEGQQEMITCRTGDCKPQATITWYKDGTDITSDSSATAVSSGTLIQTRSTLTYTGDRNDREIYCKAQNIQSTDPVTSQLLQVNVQFAPAASPAITAKPQSLHYNIGTSVTLTCELSGGNPLASLTWQCKGKLLRGSNQNTTGVARSSLPLTVDSSYNDQQCICTASHHLFSSNRSTGFTFSVLFAPTTSPVITANPYLSHYDNGTSVTLTCKLSGGNPLASLTWQCKGRPLSGSNQSIIGVASSSLTLTMDNSYDGQQCICTATHQLLSSDKTTHFTFSVHFAPTTSPVITAHPYLPHYSNGISVTLTCKLSGGNPLASLTWHCKGHSLSGSNQSTTGIARSSLTLIMDSTYNGQQCTCTASHRLLSSDRTTHYTFSVLYPPIINTLEIVEGLPIVNEHSQVKFVCKVKDGPVSTITWKKVENNTVIHTDHNVNVSYLTLQSATCLDTGSYLATAHNGLGLKSENTTILSVKCSPRLYKSNNKESSNIFGFNPDESLIINLEILSNPSPSFSDIEWNFHVKNTNGTRIIKDGIDGFTTPSYLDQVKQRVVLNKKKITTDDYGKYTVRVRNELGLLEQVFEVQRLHEIPFGTEESVKSSETVIFGALFGIFCIVSISLFGIILYMTRKRGYLSDKKQTTTTRDVYDDLQEAQKDENKYEDILKDAVEKESNKRGVYDELQNTKKDENQYEAIARQTADSEKDTSRDNKADLAQGHEERIQMYDYADTDQLKLKKIKSAK